MHTSLIFKVSLHSVLSSSTEWIWMMIASVMLTHPPARISAGRGMVSSWLVNLSLTKSFTWRKNKGKETQRRRRRSQMRHNRSLDGRALMLTCGCSRILIAKCVSSSLHVFFHSQWIVQNNFLSTLSYAVEWLAVSLIAFSGATPMSCGRRPAKYYS